VAQLRSSLEVITDQAKFNLLHSRAEQTSLLVEVFFALARERQTIFLKKQAGEPKTWWTQDEIFTHYRFTNVFREQDRTTRWLRENVRAKWGDSPDILLATLVYRWFNRVEVGEIVFNKMVPGKTYTPWEALRAAGDLGGLEWSVRQFEPKGPWTTGAYNIATPEGLDKLAGVCHNIGQFLRTMVRWREIALGWYTRRATLEEAWRWLKGAPWLGPFMAYEVITDLRYTPILEHAPDKDTWANLGPGSRRGINRILRLPPGEPMTEAQGVKIMRDLLEYSRRAECWPAEWGRWELREVEMWLCEFDKYLRVAWGEGKIRGTRG
jgi:alpha-glutamyl/putrescinyl thymine pyrophosphorylase clade 1